MNSMNRGSYEIFIRTNGSRRSCSQNGCLRYPAVSYQSQCPDEGDMTQIVQCLLSWITPSTGCLVPNHVGRVGRSIRFDPSMFKSRELSQDNILVPLFAIRRSTRDRTPVKTIHLANHFCCKNGPHMKLLTRIDFQASTTVPGTLSTGLCRRMTKLHVRILGTDKRLSWQRDQVFNKCVNLSFSDHRIR